METGRYALALAWAAPVMLAARMQLRYVLAADVERRLPFGVAASARLWASVLAVAALSMGAWLTAAPETALAIALVALIRAAEDAGDLLMGFAQRDDDWGVIARSMALRGLGGAAVFGAALALRPELAGALGAALAWQAAVTLWHDWPAVRERVGEFAPASWRVTLHAVRAHVPLGAAAALVSLNAYIPRYALERSLGLEAVGVFTALAQLALAGNMAVQAVGQAAVAPLSRAYGQGAGPFLRKLAGLLVFASLAGAAGAAAALAFGAEVLALVYRPEYAGYGRELVWLMAAAGFTYWTAMLGYALVASGERRIQLQAFALSAAVALAASAALTPAWGLQGAVAALLAAWIASAAASAAGLAWRLRPWRPRAAWRTLSQWMGWETPQPGDAR